MSTQQEVYAAMLQQMRREFAQDLPERLQEMENLVLQLEHNPSDSRSFEELYRHVHSLKGLGGTMSVPQITSICHQWESLLQEDNVLDESTFSELSFKYIDLLENVGQAARDGDGTLPDCDARLEQLRRNQLQERYPILVAESSRMMKTLIGAILKPHPVHLSTVESGFEALERLIHSRFQCVLLGGELKDLNGLAVAAALRASHSPNRDIPIVLITSSQPELPQLHIEHVLKRDNTLKDSLGNILGKLTGKE